MYYNSLEVKLILELMLAYLMFSAEFMNGMWHRCATAYLE